MMIPDMNEPVFTGDLEEAAPGVAEIAELAGGLAHELRNPLSTMMINLKLLSEDLEDSETHPENARRRAALKVDGLRREAERLQHLFDDFLNLVGPCRLDIRPTDLRTIVARLAEFFEPLAHGERVTVETDGRESPVVCDVDEKLIRQALLNLVVNAQQAMPDGGVLRIKTNLEEHAATIAVTDSGVGIAAVDRDRIFRPFYSTKPQGTGLGLSITRRIVREHGGTLDYCREPSGGTTFTIRLPLHHSRLCNRPVTG